MPIGEEGFTTPPVPNTTPAAGSITNAMLAGSIAASKITGTAATGGGTCSGTCSGTNTGDQTNISGNAATVTNGVYTTNNLSALAATTSAQLAGVLSDEIGSGKAVFATRSVVNMVYSETGAVATGSTTLPFDDTIPQNTEGVQFMTLSITPQSVSNILCIEIEAFAANDSAAAQWMTMALFQDSTANAVAAQAKYQTLQNGGSHFTLRHTMVAGTTSSTTFNVRIGGASAGTTTFNGVSGGRELGGVMASSIKITEYTP